MTHKVDVVGAAILRDGTIFAARRGSGKAQAGLWEFPGGKIEPGETPEAALKRELKEELRIDARVTDHICTSIHAYETVNIRLAVYFCELHDGEPVLTEHADSGWFPIAELHHLEWAPADIEAVERIQEIFS